MRGVDDTYTGYSCIEELEEDTYEDRELVPKNAVRKNPCLGNS